MSLYAFGRSSTNGDAVWESSTLFWYVTETHDFVVCVTFSQTSLFCFAYEGGPVCNDFLLLYMYFRLLKINEL